MGLLRRKTEAASFQCVSYLQVVVLPLLLSFQVETSQSSQVLLTHGLVHSRSTADSLTIVVGGVGPPIGFSLHVAQDHVLDGSREARHLQGMTSQITDRQRPDISVSHCEWSLCEKLTFQGMLAFQHLQDSLRCCRMVLALFCLIPSGIMSKMSCITAARNSRSK